MRQVFATWLLEKGQGECLEKIGASFRLLSYFHTKEKESELFTYVTQGRQSEADKKPDISYKKRDKNKIALIGCSSRKLEYPCYAYQLYSISARFSNFYWHARGKGYTIYIVSGKYGLIEEKTIIEPYNQKINKKVIKKVNAQLKKDFKGKFIISYLAGDYSECLVGVDHTKVTDETGLFNIISFISSDRDLSLPVKPKVTNWLVKDIYLNGPYFFDTIKKILIKHKLKESTIRAQLNNIKRSDFLEIKEGLVYFKFSNKEIINGQGSEKEVIRNS